jgi:hypothetical protein
MVLSNPIDLNSKKISSTKKVSAAVSSNFSKVKGIDDSYEMSGKVSRPVPLKLADNKENYG